MVVVRNIAVTILSSLLFFSPQIVAELCGRDTSLSYLHRNLGGGCIDVPGTPAPTPRTPAPSPTPRTPAPSPTTLAPQPVTEEDLIYEFYEVVDSDHSDVVEFEELFEYMIDEREYKENIVLTEAQIEAYEVVVVEMFVAMDTSYDGEIDEEEFVDYMLVHYPF